MIDLAWGVKAAKHQKKIDKEANAPPPPDHPESREMLRLDPIGQDSTRKRYWALDGLCTRISGGNKPNPNLLERPYQTRPGSINLEILGKLLAHFSPSPTLEKSSFKSSTI